MNFDALCVCSVEKAPGVAVAWVLMASYAYYVEDDPILSDGCFDRLCRTLAQDWDDIRHPHKDILSREDLACGSAFFLRKGDYPGRVIGGLHWLRTRGAGQKDLCSSPPAIPPSPVVAVSQGGQLLLF